jgi:hypothetical protein
MDWGIGPECRAEFEHAIRAGEAAMESDLFALEAA